MDVRRRWCVYLLSLLGGCEASEGRLLTLPRQMPVHREDGRVGVRPAREKRGDSSVQLSATTGRDVVVHGFPQQVMAEPVSGRVDHQQVRVTCLPEGQDLSRWHPARASRPRQAHHKSPRLR